MQARGAMRKNFYRVDIRNEFSYIKILRIVVGINIEINEITNASSILCSTDCVCLEVPTFLFRCENIFRAICQRENK